MKKVMTLHQVIDELVEALEILCGDREVEYSDRFSSYEDYHGYCTSTFMLYDCADCVMGIIGSEKVKYWINADSFAAWKLSELGDNLDRFIESSDRHKTNSAEVLDVSLCRACIRWLKYQFTGVVKEDYGLSGKLLNLYRILNRFSPVSFDTLFDEGFVESESRNREAIRGAVKRLKEALVDTNLEIEIEDEHVKMYTPLYRFLLPDTDNG